MDLLNADIRKLGNMAKKKRKNGTEKLTTADLEVLAQFNGVVKAYLKMKRLQAMNGNEE